MRVRSWLLIVGAACLAALLALLFVSPSLVGRSTDRAAIRPVGATQGSSSAPGSSSALGSSSAPGSSSAHGQEFVAADAGLFDPAQATFAPTATNPDAGSTAPTGQPTTAAGAVTSAAVPDPAPGVVISADPDRGASTQAAVAAGATTYPQVAAAARRPSPRPTVTVPTTAPGGAARPLGIAEPALISMSAAVQKSELAAMKSFGITSVRLDARWDWVQYGGPGTYDWADVDQAVNAVRTAGMTVDLLVAGCPVWAASPDRSATGACHPASASQFGQWAGALAARYYPQGVRVFEIWNEPNQAASWGSSADPAAYTAILAAAYQAIKKVGSDTIVVSGGLAPVSTAGGSVNGIAFLTSMYARGAKNSFDALGYHPYSYPALPATFATWSGWSQMSETATSLRSVMTANGDSAKKIWITEVGAPTRGPHGVGDQQQAQTLVQAVTIAAAAPWVGALYVYTWRDAGTNTADDEDWFGVMTASGTQKPSYAQLRSAIQSSWR